MPLLRKFTAITTDDDNKKTKIPKLSLSTLSAGLSGVTVSGGVVMASGTIIAIVVVGLVFLGIWIAGLVRMRRSCPGVPPSLYWILTLVLGLVPTGATQLAALVMAGYGLARPAIGCSR